MLVGSRYVNGISCRFNWPFSVQWPHITATARGTVTAVLYNDYGFTRTITLGTSSTTRSWDMSTAPTAGFNYAHVRATGGVERAGAYCGG